MKKTLTIAAIGLILAMLTYILIPNRPQVPKFSLQTLEGQTINQTDLQNKVSLLNFWFPSCPGCVSEMPKIIQTAKDYRHNPKFQILAIAQPIDSLETVRRYRDKYRLPFTVLYDTEAQTADAFQTYVYPTTILIGTRGQILKTYIGEPDFKQLYQDINAALPQK